MDSGPKMQLNEKGSVSLVAILFFMAFIAIIFSNMARSLEELKLIQYYNRSYICAKKVVSKYDTFYKMISISNASIRTLYYLQFTSITPQQLAGIKLALRMAKMGQASYRGLFRFQLLNIKECKKENLIHLGVIDPLGKRIWKIKRNFDQTAKMEKKWNAYMPFHYRGSNLDEIHSFAIKLNFKLKENLFSNDFYLSSQHLGPMGIQQLKEFYGLQFL